ncbi:hypothetical protein DFH28DRAFT_1116918 [Melampsora americana]|nr:hypothetical protein DFH28DRAFT_1116918 [Melampsora americana]
MMFSHQLLIYPATIFFRIFHLIQTTSHLHFDLHSSSLPSPVRSDSNFCQHPTYYSISTLFFTFITFVSKFKILIVLPLRPIRYQLNTSTSISILLFHSIVSIFCISLSSFRFTSQLRSISMPPFQLPPFYLYFHLFGPTDPNLESLFVRSGSRLLSIFPSSEHLHFLLTLHSSTLLFSLRPIQIFYDPPVPIDLPLFRAPPLFNRPPLSILLIFLLFI